MDEELRILQKRMQGLMPSHVAKRCVAVYCNLQCFATCGSVLRCAYSSAWQCDAVCCSVCRVLQCVVVCCGVLEYSLQERMQGKPVLDTHDENCTAGR